MPTLNLQVSADNNDCSSRDDGAGRAVTSENPGLVGYSSGHAYHTAYRFTNVTVPPGATITSATLEFYSQVGSSGTVTVHLHAEAANNPGAFELYNHDVKTIIDGGNLTSAYVAWSVPAWSSYTWYTSPDVAAVIQEIVNRSGWASGNAIVIVVEGVSGDNTRRICHYSYGASYAAKLNITYCVPVTLTAPTATSKAVGVVPTLQQKLLLSVPTADVRAMADSPALATGVRVSTPAVAAAGLSPTLVGGTTPIAWTIEIDWDNDGIYTNEAHRALSLQLERGRDGILGEMEPGKLTVLLDNGDGRYTPSNTASPLYPYILPRRNIRVKATYRSQEYSLFCGIIDDIRPSSSAHKVVAITATDRMRWLVGREATIQLAENIRTDEAIGLLLDAVGWPAGDRELEAGETTLRYFWFSRVARVGIDELVRSEHGAFFVDGSGKAVFRNRTSYIAGTSTEDIDESMVSEAVGSQPWDLIHNNILVRAYPTRLADMAVVWELTETGLQLTAGESVEIWVEYVDSHNNRCPAKDVQTPVANTDYTANTAEDGSGSDMTPYLSVTLYAYSETAKLVLRNTHASQALYVTKLQLRGKAIERKAVGIRREDSASQAEYGESRLTVDVPWLQDTATATSIADMLISFYASPRTHVLARLTHRPDPCLGLELMQRVRVVLPSLGVAEEMRVGKIQHRTGITMQELITTLELEPCDNTIYWLLGVSGYSELGVTTRLGS